MDTTELIQDQLDRLTARHGPVHSLTVTDDDDDLQPGAVVIRDDHADAVCNADCRRARRAAQVTRAALRRGSGDGCVKMSESHVNSCSDVPYCPGGWTKSDGTVHCTEATRRDPPPASVFCCDSTGTDGNGRKVGDGCDYVVDESATCAARPLVCSGAWVMPDRTVTCR